MCESIHDIPLLPISQASHTTALEGATPQNRLDSTAEHVGQLVVDPHRTSPTIYDGSERIQLLTGRPCFDNWQERWSVNSRATDSFSSTYRQILQRRDVPADPARHNLLLQHTTGT